MTDPSPLLPIPSKDHGHAKPAFQRRMFLLIICMGILVVVGTQYWAAERTSQQVPTILPMFSKDDFMAGLVADFRYTLPKLQRTNLNPESDGMDEEPGLTYRGTPLHVVFSTSCSEQMHWYVKIGICWEALQWSEFFILLFIFLFTQGKLRVLLSRLESWTTRNCHTHSLWMQ